MIFSLRISKLVAFTQATQKKKKKKNPFFLKRQQNMLEKKHGTQCGIFFLLLFAGVFFPLSLLFTKQNNSKVNFISNFEKRLVTSKNIYVFIFLFSEKSLKEA
jgi:hypothetical protein